MDVNSNRQPGYRVETAQSVLRGQSVYGDSGLKSRVDSRQAEIANSTLKYRKLKLSRLRVRSSSGLLCGSTGKSPAPSYIHRYFHFHFHFLHPTV